MYWFMLGLVARLFKFNDMAVRYGVPFPAQRLDAEDGTGKMKKWPLTNLKGEKYIKRI